MKTTPRNHLPRTQRQYPAIEPLESRIAPATIIVNVLGDTPVAGKTDLRQALALADTALSLHPGVVNTIKFALPAPAAHTENIITLGGTALSSNGDVNIVGPGAGKLIISGNGASGVFSIGGTTGTTTISGLSIVNGNLGNGGAGIYCTESLTLKNVVISGNTSTSFGAGVNIHGNTTTPPKLSIVNSLITGNSNQNNSSAGIDLFETGSFTITKSAISGNAVGIAGGFSNGSTISGSVISGNANYGLDMYSSSPTAKITISGTKIADNKSGGATLSGGNVLITGSTIENNTAVYTGGGLVTTGAASVTISKSSIIGNRTTATNAADQGGGGIFVSGSGTGAPTPVKITGSSISDNSSALDGGGLFAENGIALSVSTSKFAGNQAHSGAGGGIATRGATATGVVNLTVKDALFTDNVSSRGGAIAAEGATGLEGNGSFSIIASIVAGNSSLGADAGITVATSAAVTVTDTVVTNNFAAAFGGGMDIVDTQQALITGSFITDNSATGNGGGLRLFSIVGTIKDSTITGNVAGGGGGGIYLNGAGPVTIESSNVSANTAPSHPDTQGSGIVFS